jgi:hypothetical protein
MADALARAVVLFSLRPHGLESDVTTLVASARRIRLWRAARGVPRHATA